MTMLEKIARAILEADVRASAADYPDVPMADIMVMAEALFKAHHLPMAIAAVKAMREPTKEMVEPGYQAIHDCIDFYNYDSGAGYSVEPSGAADVWRAMIDSILATHPQEQER